MSERALDRNLLRAWLEARTAEEFARVTEQRAVEAARKAEQHTLDLSLEIERHLRAHGLVGRVIPIARGRGIWSEEVHYGIRLVMVTIHLHDDLADQLAQDWTPPTEEPKP